MATAWLNQIKISKMAEVFKTFKEISREFKWGKTVELTEYKKSVNWEDAEKGLLIRQTEAMELMASGYQHLLDEVERYKRGYQDMKNRKEYLEAEIIQLKKVKTRYQNQRDRLKAEMEEKLATI